MWVPAQPILPSPNPPLLTVRNWSMAAVHFEDWITRKRSLRPSLWESAYVGYQAETSVTARTALGRLPAYTNGGWPAPRFMKLGCRKAGTRHRLLTLHRRHRTLSTVLRLWANTGRCTNFSRTRRSAISREGKLAPEKLKRSVTLRQI